MRTITITNLLDEDSEEVYDAIKQVLNCLKREPRAIKSKPNITMEQAELEIKDWW